MSSFTDWQTTLRGNPPNNDHEIDPLVWLEGMKRLELKLAGGIKTYQDDLSALNLVTADNEALAFVLHDSVPANNGVYQGNGATWVKIADLPEGFAALQPGAVANDKLAVMGQATFKARLVGADGVPQDVTVEQARDLLNVSDGATANAPDADLTNRANHTGSQPMSSVDGLQDVLADVEVKALSADIDQSALSERELPAWTLEGIIPHVVVPDGQGGFLATDYTSVAIGDRVIENLRLGENVATRGGVVPIATDAADGLLSGVFQGVHALFRPACGLMVDLQPDANGVQQLYLSKQGANFATEWTRQLTYATQDVTGYEWQAPPNGLRPAHALITRAEQRYPVSNHRVGRAMVPCYAPNTATPTKATMLAIMSQSQGVGAGSGYGAFVGAQTVHDLMPVAGEPFPARLLRFNGGVMPHQVGVATADRLIAIDAAQLAGFVPLREGDNTNGVDRETFASAMALHLNGPNGYDGGRYIIAATFGHGGCALRNLTLDGGVQQQPYLNLLAGVQAAQTLCAAQNIDLEVIVVLDQGETLVGDTRETWKTQLFDWHDDLITEIGAITGQASVDLFLAQTLSDSDFTPAPAASALAQVDAARERGNVHLMPPAYFAEPEGDDIHYTATAHQWRGAMYGEAIADVLVRGVEPALTVQSATYSGNAITVQFSHPVTIDADTILNLDHTRGLGHENLTGATQAIESVRIDPADATVVRITLDVDVPPSANEVLLVAGDTATAPRYGRLEGLRSNLRRPDWVRASLIDGRPLFAFASIDTPPITEE